MLALVIILSILLTISLCIIFFLFISLKGIALSMSRLDDRLTYYFDTDDLNLRNNAIINALGIIQNYKSDG